jgi:hypothetical protein
MNRREAIKNGLACLIPGIILPEKRFGQTQQPIQGVGVSYFPPGETEMPDGLVHENGESANEIAADLCQACTLIGFETSHCLPRLGP